MKMSHSIPEPFQSYLLLCMGIGFILSLAGSAWVGLSVVSWVCNKAYVRGRHTKAFMEYMAQRDHLRAYKKKTDEEIERAVVHGIMRFRHEIDDDKIILHRGDGSNDVLLKQFAQMVRIHLTAIKLR